MRAPFQLHVYHYRHVVQSENRVENVWESTNRELAWFNSSLAWIIREAITCPDYSTTQDVYFELRHEKGTITMEPNKRHNLLKITLCSHWQLLYNFWKHILSVFNSNISASKMIPADLLLKIGPLFIPSHILIYNALTLCDWYNDKGSTVSQIHVTVKRSESFDRRSSVLITKWCL